MPLRRSVWVRLGLTLAVVLAQFALPARADDEDKTPWQDVPALEWQKPWRQWLFGAGFVMICVGIAFKNPHRSHLD